MSQVTRIVNMKDEPHDIYIGRGSKWGCPFTVIKDRPTLAKEVVGSKEEALAKYREYVLASPDLIASLDELDGKVLVASVSQKSVMVTFFWSLFRKRSWLNISLRNLKILLARFRNVSYLCSSKQSIWN